MFKKKLATAVATAGLLAGIFGSAFAPVARAAGVVNTGQIWSELTDIANVYDDFYEWYHGDDSATGKTSYPDGDPWVIYAPEYNDGAADDGSILVAACSEVADDDIEDLAGDDLSDSDDVTVTASATNGALVYLDADGAGYSGDFVDWDTSATFEAENLGFTVCVTAPDDDSSFATTLSVKVNGEALKPIYAVVVGPALSMTLQDKAIAAGTSDTNGWIAMDNNEVDYAARLRVFDKQGANLVSWLYDEDTIEDNAITGYESDDYDIRFIINSQAIGSDFSTSLINPGGAADDTLRKVDVASDFCDSYSDETGDSKKITPVFDYADGGTLTSSDKVQTAGAITLKCSADGLEANVVGLDFGTATPVAAGDVVPMYIRIDDGYGNRLGLGTDYDIDPGMNDGMFYYQYWIDSPAALIPSPAHWKEDNNVDSESWLVNDGVVFEYEAPSDANSQCDPNPMNEDEYAPSSGDEFEDYMGTSDDNAGAGSVKICYYASQISSDLGVNTVKLSMTSVYGSTLSGIIGDVPGQVKASITVVAEGGVALGTALTKSGNTVSVTGRPGTKVTFVVENAKGVTRSYVRLVGANGKATFRFKNAGKFDVYAVQGDAMTSLLRVKIK